MAKSLKQTNWVDKFRIVTLETSCGMFACSTNLQLCWIWKNLHFDLGCLFMNDLLLHFQFLFFYIFNLKYYYIFCFKSGSCFFYTALLRPFYTNYVKKSRNICMCGDFSFCYDVNRKAEITAYAKISAF